ncbi:GerAB/ArcD/ProY family transporter [Bacillus sp. NTK071]|uniref:GerAB/ArcD/ProY family transporter n=1 Tax=Bacillus sp. NTK071 TaxID=2802175 RepID=UPI001A8F36CD|nr:GerAB/ArcD/ProY family transporter [Bacillus sp. NTK071]MBN8209727.1 GerAB/ArcD/ProY family transporter [Bacillus sp. NTK071]
MEENKRNSLLISPFLIMFVIHSNQIGVGILGFPRYIAAFAGNDSWIVVLITGAVFHIFIWMMYRILSDGTFDIIDLHNKWFGKWIGSILNCALLLYLLLGATVILRTFVEVIQAWMFPELATWIPAAMYLFLTYYVLAGGFRTVTGICFFGVIIPIWLAFTTISPAKLSSYSNLLPILDHSIMDFVQGTKQMTLSFLGAEILLLAYPFLKNPNNSRIWAHMGIALTTILYSLVMVVSLAFYSSGQLQQSIWSTLIAWKVVELPFLERFEYLGITFWCFVVFPNICLNVWGASRIGKKVFYVKQKYFALILITIVFIVCILMTNREQIDYLNTLASKIGSYFYYFYLPFIFLYSTIWRRVKKRK